MKTLVVGASGQVGTQMLSVLGQRALASSRTQRDGWLQLDLARLESVAQAAGLLDEHMLDAIYCVGGMTYVDGCEAEPEQAWRTNARGPAVLAAYAMQRGLPYVFFSTDYVFDGAPHNPGPYAEDAATNPLSIYGRTKLAGEALVMAAYSDALVVRTTVVYGPDPRQKNYIYSLMRTLAAAHTMKAPMDQISTPTYNRDLIAVTMALVEAKATGIFHVAGPELLDRLDFARRVAMWLGLDAGLLEGVTTAQLGQPAARPLASGLAMEKLARLHPELRMRTLQEALIECGAELREFLQCERT